MKFYVKNLFFGLRGLVTNAKFLVLVSSIQDTLKSNFFMKSYIILYIIGFKGPSKILAIYTVSQNSLKPLKYHGI